MALRYQCGARIRLSAFSGNAARSCFERPRPRELVGGRGISRHFRQHRQAYPTCSKAKSLLLPSFESTVTLLLASAVQVSAIHLKIRGLFYIQFVESGAPAWQSLELRIALRPDHLRVCPAGRLRVEPLGLGSRGRDAVWPYP